MFETIRLTHELMQTHQMVDQPHMLSMLQMTQLSSTSTTTTSTSLESDFSLSDYAERYETARDAYLEVERDYNLRDTC